MQALSLAGKSVFVVENHHQVLEAWCDIRQRHHGQLILLTFDHHTDTLPAFNRFVYRPDPLFWAEQGMRAIAERVAAIDIRDSRSVRAAVKDLRNDEHIDAAIRLNIFDLAVTFTTRGSTTQSIEEQNYYSSGKWMDLKSEPPAVHSYELPENKIFNVSKVCAIGCSKGPHDEDCVVALANQAIESVMVKSVLDQASVMTACAGIPDAVQAPFVLDIDLDYFRTVGSLSPRDPLEWHRLLRAATAITIATEPSFVECGRLDDALTSEIALTSVKAHIEAAMVHRER